jgi:CO/xanthine dehydrogenase Mo-binding subunit
MRDGNERIGWGMATGVWDAMLQKAEARAVLTPDGRLEISAAVSDIGAGTWTILTQIGAEAFGVPLESVTVRIGDSMLPTTPVEGGSWTAATSGAAVRSQGRPHRAQDRHGARPRHRRDHACGRLLNPKTARSQILGGVVMGIGMALHEETMFDHGLGKVMNQNIAEYHMPVQAARVTPLLSGKETFP